MRSPYEIKAQKQLEVEGYKVDYKVRPRIVARGYQVDFFGLFDLMAYKEGVIRFISVKGHAGVPSVHRQAIESFIAPVDCTKEIWVFSKKKINKILLS